MGGLARKDFALQRKLILTTVLTHHKISGTERQRGDRTMFLILLNINTIVLFRDNHFRIVKAKVTWY